ncbi:MAG: hypothetical protein ABSE73_18130 [Planctomycetota bacterium]
MTRLHNLPSSLPTPPLPALFVLAGALFACALAQGEDTRLPVPPEGLLKEAEKTIKDLFKAEFAKAKTVDKAEFAQKLLQAGVETKDDPITRYALLREAAAQAAQAGEAATAVKVITEMAKSYKVDAVALKLEALTRGAGAAATPEAHRALAALCTALVGEAMAEDNYDAAMRATASAEAAALRAQDRALVTQSQELAREARALQSEFAKAKGAKETLAEKPDDPNANLSLGKFLCFAKGDWEKGVPLLAKGGDEPLKVLAAKDLAKPDNPAEQAALGDSWADMAEKQTGMARTHLLERACMYWESSLPGLTGAVQLKVQKRLESALPPRRTLNLLPLIDPVKDTVAGTWKIESGALVSGPVVVSRVEIPYRPPEEYDFRIVFTPVRAVEMVQVLSKSGKSFTWAIWGATPASVVMGFELIAGTKWNVNKTAVKTSMVAGRRYTSCVQVRKDGIKALVDGKCVTQWKTDYSDMSNAAYWDMRDTTILGLGCSSPTIFHSIEVIEVRGQGKKTR